MSTIIPNGTFTVNNKAKGTHRTIKIATVRKGNLKDKRIISLMTGCNNENDYSGFGFVNENGSIAIWNKHKGSNTMVWLAGYICNQFSQYKKDVEGVELLVEKRCLVCNRKLTTPESIELGVGPECIKRSSALGHSASLIENQEAAGVV